MPSSGKSYLGQRVLRPSQNTAYTTTLTPDQPSSDLLGFYMVKGHDMVWHDGVAARAWREGNRLVLNEVDQRSPEVETLLHVILDDPATTQLTLPTGETIRPQPGFQAVATMNGNPAEMPEALRSRFTVQIHMTTVNPAALMAIPVEYRMAVKRAAEVTDSARRITLRVWLEFFKLRPIVGDEVAAKACFGIRGPEILATLKLATAAA